LTKRSGAPLRGDRSGASVEGDEEPWYADGLRFTCTRCGDCCRGPEPGYVRVGQAEIERIAAALGLDVDEFGRTYLRQISSRLLSLTEHPNKDCIFWEEGRGCQVYEARPDQCRTFPFWPELLADQDLWDSESERCPGMDRGRRYSRKRIEAIAAFEKETAPGRKTPGRASRRAKQRDPQAADKKATINKTSTKRGKRLPTSGPSAPAPSKRRTKTRADPRKARGE
jgi:uncharacterized protein